MKLNIGCGEFYAYGWFNADLHNDHPNGPRPDIVCSVLGLPFDDASCSHVYAGHVLEHLDLDTEVPVALREIRRVLCHDGQLMIVGPDLTRAKQSFPESAQGIVEGGNRWLGDEHKWPSTCEATLRAVRTVFPQAREIPVGNVGAPWPLVSAIGWQFAIHCPV